MSEQANAGFHTSVAGYALTTSKEVQGEGVKLSGCSSLSFTVAVSEILRFKYGNVCRKHSQCPVKG